VDVAEFVLQPVKERFEIAKSIIVEAGSLAEDYFGKLSTLTVKTKGLHDLVSEADVNTEKFIRENLNKRFPADAFFGEESGPCAFETNQGVWVVDPIDGTQPFLLGIPNWCISIAYVEANKLQFGLIYAPSLNELFAGGIGIPATLNDHPIHPSKDTDLHAGLVSIGFSPRTSQAFLFASLQKLFDQKGMYVRNGSGALSLAYVACGRFLGHIEPHMHSWDCLGGLAIIAAAGGGINQFKVSDAIPNGTQVIATAPKLYDQLQKVFDESLAASDKHQSF
jgi:myo-inositol-1(or 4)-monophosphatase